MNKSLLIAVCIASFFSAFMSGSLNIAVPFIAESYKVSPESITWVINAFMITTASFLLPTTALANRYGYYKIFTLGTAFAFFTSLLVPFSPNFLSLLICRALQGMSFSMLFCTSMALLVYSTPKEHRSFAIGITVASVYAGLSLSPLLGGFIIDFWGWQTIFYVTCIGECICFILCKFIPQDKPNSSEFKLKKMAICFIAGCLCLYSISSFQENHLSKYLLIFGILLVIYYLILERESQSPVFPIKLVLQNKILTYALFSSTFNYMANFTLSLLLSLHLQLIYGLSAFTTGMFLSVTPAIMMLLSVLTGKTSKHLNHQMQTILGMLFILSGTFLLIFLHKETSLIYIVVAQILNGIGFGLFSAPNTSIVMGSVNKTQYALASALQALSRTFGMACGMAILTTILNAIIKISHADPQYGTELSFALRVSFGVSCIICLLGLVFCILGQKKEKFLSNN